MPTISKVLETPSNPRLKYLETHILINDRYYGFTKQWSIADLLTYVMHIWNSSVQTYVESSIFALNIAKTFDMMWLMDYLLKSTSGLSTSFLGVVDKFWLMETHQA